MKTSFIDTHAHLDFLAKRENGLEEALVRARDAGVSGIVACSASRGDWPLYSRLAAEHRGQIWWQFGIHPTEISEGDADTLERDFEKYMNSGTPPVAVGEIGLDFYRLPNDEAEAAREAARQTEMFRLQLALAKKAGLPVCVHARNAVHECIETISESGLGFENVVFHCFSGSADDIKTLNALGGRGSFTGIITYKSAGQMRDAMLAQGLSRLMFETDCPYLAPVPRRGGENEPSYIPLVAAKAAEVFGVTPEEIAEITTRNARAFFRL